MTIEAAKLRIQVKTPEVNEPGRRVRSEETLPTPTGVTPQGDSEPASKTFRGLYNRVVNSDLDREQKAGLINRIKGAATNNSSYGDDVQEGNNIKADISKAPVTTGRLLGKA
ncbi:MAG: hypothetical protein SGJ02_07785 [bacterium]|nr:hypothetical protein [bacterium]